MLIPTLSQQLAALRAKTSAYWDEGRYNEAIEAAREIVVLALPCFMELDVDSQLTALQALEACGDAEWHHGKLDAALELYQRVIELCDTPSIVLNLERRACLFRALFKSGQLSLTSGQDDDAIKVYERILARGQEFTELPREERILFFRTCIEAGNIHRNNGQPEAALQNLHLAGRLGSKYFLELVALEKESVLQALHNSGTILAECGDWTGALTDFEAGCSLGLHLFDSDHGVLMSSFCILLQTVYLSSVASERLGNLEWALTKYQYAATMGEETFADLDSRAREVTFRARACAGQLFSKLKKHDAAINEYTRALTLGEPNFANLSANERCTLLEIAHNLGFSLKEIGDPHGAADVMRRMADIGEIYFGCLDDEGRLATLECRSGAGFAFEQANLPAQALVEYSKAIELASYKTLNPAGRAEILKSYYNSGVIYESANAYPAALQCFKQVIAQGDSDFKSLGKSGRQHVLFAHYNAGIVFSKASNWEDAISHHERLVELGERHLHELNIEGRNAVLLAHISEWITADLRGRSDALSLVKAIFLADACVIEKAEIAHRGTAKIVYADCRRVDVNLLEDVASWWLVRLKGYPARPEHPRQSGQALALGATLVLGELARLRRLHRDWLQAALAETTPRTWPRQLSQAMVERLLPGPPEVVPDDGAMLLARVRAAAADTRGWPEQAPWRLDADALYLQVQAGLFAPDGERRAPYAWLAEAAQPRLDFARYGEAARRCSHTLGKVLEAWRAGEPSAAVQLLERAWRAVAIAGARPLVASEPAGQAGEFLTLSRALQHLGVAAPDAQAQALDALIYGDERRCLEQACTAWIEARCAVQPGQSPQAQAEAVLQQLFQWLSPLAAQGELFERVGRFVPHPSRRDAPTTVWQLLELQRFALASVAAEPQAMRPADTQSTERLQAAVRVQQAQLALRLERIKAGAPDDWPALETHDHTQGLFDALQVEHERLGRTLQLPDAPACAERLRPGEALVQVWFAASGSAQLLVLRPSGELQQHALAPALAWPQWQPLLAAWATREDVSARVWRDGFAQAAHAEADYAQARAAVHAAWLAFVATGSPASQLLQALREQLPEAEQLHLLLPAELARLPWLARAVSGTLAEHGDFKPGWLVLETSTSTWWQQRRTPPIEALVPTVRHLPLEAEGFARLEVQQVAAQLGCAAQPADGVLGLAQALQAAGPVHLVAHGRFETTNPMASRLSLSAAQGELPAWLLPALQLRGDISLSACESMLVGPQSADARWSGAVGIGPLLRARGARSVVGALGRADQLSSALFYSLWHEQRCHLPAAQALAQAQRALRGMSARDALRRLEPDAANAQAIAQHLAWIAEDDAHPFNHPAFWAQYVLLGDAPALPAAHTSPPASPAEKPRPWWRRWFGQH